MCWSLVPSPSPWNEMTNLLAISLLFLHILSPAVSIIISSKGEAYQQRYALPASMLPPLPCGRSLQIITSQNSGILGASIWPAASPLCSYLQKHQIELGLKDTHCVELGSGTGAVGLYAAGLGSRVILTDCKPPPESAIYTTDGSSTLPASGSNTILKILEKNVHANHGIFPGVLPLVMELDWTKPEDTEKVASIGPSNGFDFVLCSDVTHFTLMHKPLVSNIARLLRPDGGICLLSHQERMLNLNGRDMQLQQFSLTARDSGLQVEHLHVDSPSKDRPIAMLKIQHASTNEHFDGLV